jgi:hypothetical protein
VSDTGGEAKSVAALAYRDLASPSAQRLGRTVARALGVALAPVNGTLWTAEQALAWLEREVQARLAKRGVPETGVQAPSAPLLGATVLGVQTAAAEPNLSEFFAELLSAAMDAQRAGSVHPSFADLIRQLAPDDARILAALARKGGRLRLHGYASSRSGRYGMMAGYSVHRVLIGFATDAEAKVPKEAAVAFDNLRRLGLCDERLEESPKQNGTRAAYLELTAFGRRFCAACVEGAPAHFGLRGA